MIRTGLVASVVASALIITSHALAAGTITAKLSKSGYTLVALDASGKAVSKRGRGTLRLTPTAGRVTLQLIDRNGRYAGPVVVGRRGSKVVVGVKAGAKLGTIVILNGYGVAHPAARWLDPSRLASARKGVPIGARVFGRVRVTSAVSRPGAGLDQDRDGVPGAFDVDDDGDLVLDNFERMGNQPAFSGFLSTLDGPPAPQGFRLFSNLKLNIEESLNVNAGTASEQKIDEAMKRAVTLAIQVPPGEEAELDCGSLSYCSTGGTGHLFDGSAFPGTFDPDADGFGTITAGTTGDFQLVPGAGLGQIGSGDAFIEHVHAGGTETQLPGILNYVFSTTPALKSWSVEGGQSGTVTYPFAPEGVGGNSTPIPVPAAGPVRVTLTFWRPQRKAISGSGEGDGWVDIGRLGYTADVPNGPAGGIPGGTRGPGNCKVASYSTSDPNLSASGDKVVDSAADQAADPANTLTFTVDLTQCLTGGTGGPIDWASGQRLGVDIQARSEFGDNAAQKLLFRRA